jgi:phosphoribosylformimino-5-aminoimidazole carboxamide ribotide isomerase
MKIYPAIEIMDGKAVNRLDGSSEPPQPYDMAPLEAAKKFAGDGAECLHIVDVDSTHQGGRHNADLICKIIDSVGIPVQVSGGIRSMDSAAWWIDHGAARIGLGTAAVKDRHMVQEVCAHYPEQVLVTIAARHGHVVVEGWSEETTFTAIELAKSFERTGVSEIVFIDLDRDTNPQEYSLAATVEMGEALEIPVISSGTVKSLDDVATLRYLPNIGGCILGRALFSGAVDLKEALETANTPYKAPEFV